MKTIKYCLILAFVQFLSWTVAAQERLFRNDTIEVFENGQRLNMPWGGGINGAQLSEIDVNFDGIKDLYVFEANNRFDPLTGDKVSIYLKLKDDSGKFYYSYAPEYKSSFPRMEYFSSLRDFNGDGKEDIFCRNQLDQIEVYRNDSDPNDTIIRFTRFIKAIESNATGLPPTYPFINVLFQDFVNMTSYEDVDGDGDIDILILDRSEQFIEYHKNISTTRDTMIFELKNTIWGDAVVSKDTVVLNQLNPQGNVPNPERNKIPKTNYIGSGGKGNKDAGVGLLALDLNGDGVKDLITSSPSSLRMLMNNGTVTSSHFNSVNFSYPPSKPIKDVALFASPSYIDLDFDGVKDLLSSVLWDEFEDFNSMSFFKNTGTNSAPVFTHQRDNFLQSQMIDVGTKSIPKFFDFNGDSLMDIIIGNEGYFNSYNYPNPTEYRSQLAIYKNVGERWDPKFELLTRNFLHLDTVILDTANNRPSTSLNPTFGDLDADGDDDMILGDRNGNIHYFENTAGAGNDMTFAPPVINYQGIKVGINSFAPGNGNASPQLIDLNKDGLLDLIIGERGGNINYYKNIGNATNPVFQLENDSLGMVSVSEGWDFFDGGFSKPFIYKEKLSQEFKLISGSKSGFLFFYNQVEKNGSLLDTFPVSDSSYQDIWIGPYSAVHGADINGDTSLDFIVGNQSGGIVLYTSTGIGFPIGVKEKTPREKSFQLYPNPASNSFSIVIDQMPLDQRIRVSIADMLGKEVDSFLLTNSGSMDLSAFKSGVYLVRVFTMDGKNLGTRKLIVQP